MKKTRLMFAAVLPLMLAVVLCATDFATAAGKADRKPVTTNKDKLLTIAVQGQIAPAQPSRSYAVTWDGTPKVLIGNGGINYNLKIGDPIFGWASGDRATMGVAVQGSGPDARARGAWTPQVSIGNEVKLLSGAAKGEKGVITGKLRGFALVHFEDSVLNKLSIGDSMLAKSLGVGLKIDGFEDVFVQNLTPEVLESLVSQTQDGRLEVPVVKEIPGDIIGRGAIQTCYPPDIEKYGLKDLRFGDIVYLEDVQSVYGNGYFKGGAVIGVISSGPSDMSGQGIAFTPILSSREGKLTVRIDPDANIGKYLGIEMKTKAPRPSHDTAQGVLKTNKDKLITTAVESVVIPARGASHEVTYDGTPRIGIGMHSINYTVSIGDPAYGWASSDHVEPDVSTYGRDADSSAECAIAILSGIGNPAKVLTGEAKGAEGFYIGRHSPARDLLWFPKDVLDKLSLDDRFQVRARSVGLKIEGFEDVRVNMISPELLEKLGISIQDGQLIVPVVMEIPGRIMGSGLGASFVETSDYDIQTTCPDTVERYNLEKLRIGDVVAIRDHYNSFGTGRHKGAVTIGIVCHGWSYLAGHGPGVNTVLSALPGRIKPRIDPHSNAAYYLGIRQKPDQTSSGS
ncbi:MAG: DUF4438 domain-containing protein [Deltaproteobacteria bacterium]|nr:DUF4438 domain-containing protein [Deltaproteobacteria bacterium]